MVITDFKTKVNSFFIEKVKLINYLGKAHIGYLELFYYLAKTVEKEDTLIDHLKVIPPSKIFFVKAALENKFKRPFSFRKIKAILKDKSWQTQCTSPQAS